MNNIMEQITLILTVISFFIIGYLIYLSFDKDKRNRLESENTPVKNSISFRLNIDKNEVDEFSLEEDNITIHNKNGFKSLFPERQKNQFCTLGEIWLKMLKF